MISFSVSDRRNKGRRIEINPEVVVYNTDISFVQQCMDISKKYITGGLVKMLSRSRNPKHNQSFEARWSGYRRIKSLLVAILPYMRSTKKIYRAKLLLDFVTKRLDREVERWKPFTQEEIDCLIQLRISNSKTGEIAPGTLEKLQRLNTEQYAEVSSKVY